MILLSRKVTQLCMPEDDWKAAIEAALWVTCSPHEWTWTQEQQAQMAMYVLWATQRLNAIKHLSAGNELSHENPS